MKEEGQNAAVASDEDSGAGAKILGHLWSLYYSTTAGVVVEVREQMTQPSGVFERRSHTRKDDPGTALSILRTITDLQLKLRGLDPLPPLTITIAYDGPEPDAVESWPQGADSNPGSSGDRKATP